MRIIGGEAGSRLLKTPKGLETRPMTDRAREALFNILGDVTDAVVLDLYAGTGALGLESLSRGAAHATFVEADRHVVEDVLTANVATLGYADRSEVVPGRVERYLLRPPNRAVDLAFVDPPYPLELASVEEVLAALGPHLAPGATVVVHRRVGEPAPEAPWPLVDERVYGSARLWWYRDERTP